MLNRKIGKNTIGDNNKMSVDLHTYNRSNHSMSQFVITPMTVGTCTPVMCEIVKPEDVWEIDLQDMAFTQPTIGPLFSTYKLRTDVFVCPVRLYNGKMHNNELGVGMDISKIKLPQLNVEINKTTDKPTQDNPNSQINPSSILSYLGRKGIAQPNFTAEVRGLNINATSYLGYWDIIKNFYINKQEDNAYFIDRALNPNSIVINHDGGNSERIPLGLSKKGNYHRLQEPIRQVDVLVIEEASLKDVQYAKINVRVYERGVRAPHNYVLGLEEFGEITEQQGGIGLIPFVQITVEKRMPWEEIADIDFFSINVEGVLDNGEVVLKSFPIKNLDQMRKDILYWDEETAFTINKNTYSPYGDIVKRRTTSSPLNSYYPLSGLAVKTYDSDLFNNWISSALIDQITQKSRVAVTGEGSGRGFNVDSLNLAKKIYNMYNRIAITGGTYEDWLDVMYPGDHFRVIERPEYIGGKSATIAFEEVISKSAEDDAPLGTLAGRGKIVGGKGGRIKVRCDEPAYIIAIASITPKLTYSQGNRFDTDLKTLADIHSPAMDNIGYQDLTADRMSWTEFRLEDAGIMKRAVGKQPAWMDYRTNYDKSFGNFAAGEDEAFMILNRNYNIDYSSGYIQDMTTYIDPSKYNYIFADVSRNATNFWIQFNFDIKVRSLMSARIMPVV